MKKGSIVDGAVLMIVILIVAMSVVMMVYVNDQIYAVPSFQAMLNASNATQPMLQAKAAVLSLNDLIVVVLFASAIAAIISASQIRAHPKFFFFSFILQIFMIILTSVVTDIYTDFVARPEITATASLFPNFATILQNAPALTFVITSLVAIASFTMGGGSRD